MKAINGPGILFLLLAGSPLQAQDAAERPFEEAAAGTRKRLQESIEELDRLRATITDEKLPLGRELNELESELRQVRLEYQQTTRLLDTRTLDLSNLQKEIESRQNEASYLKSSLLGEYVRNFGANLPVAEVQRYEEPLDAANLALENDGLSDSEMFATQIALLSASLDRLEDALGGTRFDGTAVDSNGLVKSGTFLIVGPAAIFRTADGTDVGTIEQRTVSLEPAIVSFANPEDALAAAEVVESGSGRFPLDPSLGNAHKIEATEETLWEHIQKGGPVMIPIFALAALALLIALLKWLGMMFLRSPSKRRVVALVDAVGREDEEAARETVGRLKGPVGRMLAAGVEHLAEPREMIEEAMYETVLVTRLRLQRFLPFIAISAASAPLLGLLGTVTGIIRTFKMITVFGSGDVKSLSGGISEALITTEFGLIVAIPSLLIHAFLSRKARGVVGQMERTAVAFLNHVKPKPLEPLMPAAGAGERAASSHPAGLAAEPTSGAADPDLVRRQVRRVLIDLLDDLDDRPVRRPAEARTIRRRERVPDGEGIPLGVPEPIRTE